MKMSSSGPKSRSSGADNSYVITSSPEFPKAGSAEGADRLGTAVRTLAIVLIVAGCLARIYGLTARPLWDDEAFTYYMAAQGFDHLFASLRFERHPPFFFAIEGVSVGILGGSELALRLPALIAGLALIPLVGCIGTRLWGKDGGLVAATLVAISPLMVYHSQEGRSYAVLVAVMLGGAWCLWEHAAEPSWRRGIPAVLLTLAGMYSHYFGVFLLPFAFVTLVLRGRRNLWRAAAPAAVILLGMIPLGWLMVIQRTQAYSGAVTFASDGNMSLLAEVVRSLMLLGNGGYPEGVLRLAGYGGFALATSLALIAVVKAPETRRAVIFPLLLAASLFLLMRGAGLVLHWGIRDNYIILIAPATYLLLAGAAVRVGGSSLPGRLAVLALFGVMVSGTVVLTLGNARPNPDYRTACARVAAENPDGVLLARTWGDLACYHYYRKSPAPIAVFALDPETSPTLESQVVATPLSTVTDLIGKPRLCVLGKESGRVGFDSLAQQLSQAGYRLTGTETPHGVIVQWWSLEVAAPAPAIKH